MSPTWCQRSFRAARGLRVGLDPLGVAQHRPVDGARHVVERELALRPRVHRHVPRARSVQRLERRAAVVPSSRRPRWCRGCSPTAAARATPAASRSRVGASPGAARRGGPPGAARSGLLGAAARVRATGRGGEREERLIIACLRSSAGGRRGGRAVEEPRFRRMRTLLPRPGLTASL